MQTSSAIPSAERRTKNAESGEQLYTRRREIQRSTIGRGLFTIALLLFSGCGKKEVSPQAGPPEVEVTEALQQDVPIYEEWVAQLNGPVNAEITPKVQGYLLKQNYQNGFFVEKDQLLFELDPRQYEAALDQAKAQLAVSQANLARTNTDVARDTPLAAQNAIPQKQLDNDLASQAAMKAMVEAAAANTQNAQLNLGWTKVYSPISGIAGVSNSQIGDLVGTTTKMTTVSQINPIWAYFNVSEGIFLGISKQVKGFISGKGSQTLSSKPIEYIQSNDIPYPNKGRFTYVNRQVGTQTGTIQMAAEFANPDGALRPGGFGRVRIQTGDNKNALVVPQQAVIEVQSEYQLIVLTPDNKATFRPVKVGQRIGSNWIIAEGLKPGERVVVKGIQKVQALAAQMPQSAMEGVPVIPKPYALVAAGTN
jgi:membrane fusion protein (multidrug efflux system)